jgi:hypothetical protein
MILAQKHLKLPLKTQASAIAAGGIELGGK